MSFYFKFLLTSILVVLTFQLGAQSILFNSSGGTPDPSALIELRSTEKGMLVPRMKESDRLAIPSPAQGLLVFQNNGTVGFYFYNGSAWDTLGGATTVTNITTVTNVTSSGIAVIRDEKAASTNGGTFSAGAWRKRALNTIDGDLSFVSLGTDSTFTLDSGIYVITASAPAFKVDEHQIRLHNVTLGSVEAVGNMAFSNNFAVSSSTMTIVVSVGMSGETFEIQHQCASSSVSNNGFGIGGAWGENVYTQVKIEKL